jgi:hypothetical protein
VSGDRHPAVWANGQDPDSLARAPVKVF